MRYQLLFLIAAVAAAAALVLGQDVSVPGLGVIRGQSQKTAGNLFGAKKDFWAFTNIPYGKIPQRFSRAEPKGPLTNGNDNEVFDATKPQLACWQVPSPLAPGPYTEDCLTLNVYTPKNSKKPLPVMVFIHGGSFIRWSANAFDGRRILDKDVILVTINYRLNFFGFFTLQNDETPGNLALYDAVLGLQWVKQYISHFGGDVNRITIAGQSAGGAMVTYLLDSPMAAGLFQGAISQSGDDLAGWAIMANPLQNSLSGANVVGCYNPSAPNLQATLACLRALPPDVLMQANLAFYSAPSVQNFAMTGPKVTPVSPYDSLLSSNGTHTQVPLMIGTCKNDGSFLVSRTYSTTLLPSGLANNVTYLRNKFVRDLLQSTSFGIKDLPLGIMDSLIDAYLGPSKNTGKWSDIAPGLVDVFSAFYFKSPVFTTAKVHSKFSDTFIYSFDYKGEQTVYPYTGGVAEVPRGVSHIDDLTYLFYFGEFTSTQDKLISSNMVDMWTNFVTKFNPNSESPFWVQWPKFDVDGGKFYKINTIPSVGSDYVGYWFGATPSNPK